MTEKTPGEPDADEGIDVPEAPMTEDDALLDEPDEDLSDDAPPAQPIPDE